MSHPKLADSQKEKKGLKIRGDREKKEAMDHWEYLYQNHRIIGVKLERIMEHELGRHTAILRNGENRQRKEPAGEELEKKTSQVLTRIRWRVCALMRGRLSGCNIYRGVSDAKERLEERKTRDSEI